MQLLIKNRAMLNAQFMSLTIVNKRITCLTTDAICDAVEKQEKCARCDLVTQVKCRVLNQKCRFDFNHL